MVEQGTHDDLMELKNEYYTLGKTLTLYSRESRHFFWRKSSFDPNSIAVPFYSCAPHRFANFSYLKISYPLLPSFLLFFIKLKAWITSSSSVSFISSESASETFLYIIFSRFTTFVSGFHLFCLFPFFVRVFDCFCSPSSCFKHLSSFKLRSVGGAKVVNRYYYFIKGSFFL